MPQPTTHYLVTRRAIPREHWSDWWDRFKPYFGLGSTAPDLFYFPKISLERNYSSKISDALHSERSYDLFCTMLDMAKQSKLNSDTPPNIAEKQFAFSVGFYAHVITDCIFHPYVYRSTNDHWNTKDFSNESKHKIQEFRIDRGVHRKIWGKDQEVGTTAWSCPGELPDLLEYCIVYLFNTGLTSIYPTRFTSNRDISDDSHPIQQAYNTLNSELPYLLNGQQLLLWGSGTRMNTSEIDIDDHFFSSAYPQFTGLDSYTPQDLFNFSCVACRNLFLSALDFFNSETSSSADTYFSSQPTNYLGQGNWNLDTGLLCQYNTDDMMLRECPEHYQYKVDELNRQYSKLSKLYQSMSF